MSTSSCGVGSRYIFSQTATVSRPRAPTTTNMPCQLMVRMSTVSTGGARALAICEPVLMMETGMARSSLRNHRSDTLSPAVKNGDSAMPSATRMA